MSIFIDPTGRSTFGIGICARCSVKMSLEDLMPDPNSPGLMVCEKDRDEYDPYRLPARQTERINLDFVRPDTPLGLTYEEATGFVPDTLRITEDDAFRFTEDDEFRAIEGPTNV